MCELPWYSHKSYRGYVSSPLFVKVIMIRLHKLSDLRCMGYHAIHTKRYGGYFFNTHPYAKVIRTELYKLSGCDMRVILIFTQKWSRSIPPGRQNYHGVINCRWVGKNSLLKCGKNWRWGDKLVSYCCVSLDCGFLYVRLVDLEIVPNLNINRRTRSSSSGKGWVWCSMRL